MLKWLEQEDGVDGDENRHNYDAQHPQTPETEVSAPTPGYDDFEADGYQPDPHPGYYGYDELPQGSTSSPSQILDPAVQDALDYYTS